MTILDMRGSSVPMRMIEPEDMRRAKVRSICDDERLVGRRPQMFGDLGRDLAVYGRNEKGGPKLM